MISGSGGINHGSMIENRNNFMIIIYESTKKLMNEKCHKEDKRFDQLIILGMSHNFLLFEVSKLVEAVWILSSVIAT